MAHADLPQSFRVTVTTSRISDSADVATTVAPASRLNVRPFAYSPISSRFEASRHRKHSVIGNRKPLTTCTPTSRWGGADADELADADTQIGDQHRHCREHGPAHAVLLADQLRQPLAC